MDNLLTVTIKDVDDALEELGIELNTHDKEALYRYVKDDLEIRVLEIVFDAVCDHVYYEDK